VENLSSNVVNHQFKMRRVGTVHLKYVSPDYTRKNSITAQSTLHFTLSSSSSSAAAAAAAVVAVKRQDNSLRAGFSNTGQIGGVLNSSYF